MCVTSKKLVIQHQSVKHAYSFPIDTQFMNVHYLNIECSCCF